jgi:hypothetical protein
MFHRDWMINSPISEHCRHRPRHTPSCKRARLLPHEKAVRAAPRDVTSAPYLYGRPMSIVPPTPPPGGCHLTLAPPIILAAPFMDVSYAPFSYRWTALLTTSDPPASGRVSHPFLTAHTQSFPTPKKAYQGQSQRAERRQVDPAYRGTATITSRPTGSLIKTTRGARG